MRKADAELGRPGAIETIAVAARPAPAAAHRPIELGEAKAEPRVQKVGEVGALTQHIDALGEATGLEKVRPAAPAKTRAAKAKAATPQKRAASKPGAAGRVSGEAAPTHPKRTRARKAARPTSRRQRRKGSAPTGSEP